MNIKLHKHKRHFNGKGFVKDAKTTSRSNHVNFIIKEKVQIRKVINDNNCSPTIEFEKVIAVEKGSNGCL